MRSDVFYFFPTDVVSLYNAYAQAAAQPPFERECKAEPYHTLSFGLNMSLKYNMNGGACILRFMPLPQGAAVDVHFVLAQTFGARCEAYAEALTAQAAALLELAPQRVNMDAAAFEQAQNKTVAAPVAVTTDVVLPTPVPTPAAPVPPAPAAPPTAYCPRCGTVIRPDHRFCGGCGAPIAQPAPVICPNCCHPAPPNAAFCVRCGHKL